MPLRYRETGTTGPLPLTVKEVKSYLKIDSDADEEVITLLISAVTSYAEGYTSRDLRTRSWIATLDCFQDRMELRKSEITSITSIKYFDTTPIEQTVSADDYYLRKDHWWGVVLRKKSASWPVDVDTEQAEQRITIEFKTILPTNFDEIKVALLQLVANLYENRGDCETEADAAGLASAFGSLGLLSQFRIPRI